MEIMPEAGNDIKAYEIWKCYFANAGKFAKNCAENDTSLVIRIRNIANFCV